MSESCGAPRPDVIELGTRIAIYSYAGCSILLGFMTLLSAGERRQIVFEEDQIIYIKKVLKHVKDVNQAVATSSLTGIALIAAALIHQHLLDSFTLFHAYVVMLLLWLITLTGMWFVIHAWVFDILRKDKRRMATFSFWSRIIKKSHWFTIQFSLMGGYGLYVTIRRDDFLQPECTLWFFDNKAWAYLLNGFAAVPIINACMLFMATSFFVWVASVVVAACSSRGWRGQVDPVVFGIFWLLEYVLILGGLIATIETEVNRKTSKSGTEWPFGSTLALTLVIVPLRLVVIRVWQMIYGGNRYEPTSRPRSGPLPSEAEGLMSNAHSRISTGQNSNHCSLNSTNNYGDRPPSYRPRA